MTFVLPNRKRDKKFAEGDAAYDPNTVTYEDQSDLKNMHFRYLGESSSCACTAEPAWQSGC